MPLRILTGYRPPGFGGPAGLGVIDETSLVLVGARDLVAAEVDYLAGSGIRQIDVEDLGLDVLAAGPLVLHVDMDVSTPPSCPACVTSLARTTTVGHARRLARRTDEEGES